MSEEELVAATSIRIKEFGGEVEALVDNLQKALKNIRDCRETCKLASRELGELNDWAFKKHSQ